MLDFTKEIYRQYERFPTKRTLREFVKHSGLYSQVGQELVDRLLDALHLKIIMKKRGLSGGFPRFKNIDRMKSLAYPQSGFRLLGNRKLRVSPFGEINIRKHREISGVIKTMTLKKEASGKWFVIFTAEKNTPPSEQNNSSRIGIDLGLINFATLSDGTFIKNPRHLGQYEERLAKRQRELSKKRKRSINRKIMKRKVAILHEKVRNIRKDFLHKLSNRLVRAHSFIALEDLPSQEMAQKNYGKSINDAGWSEFIRMLSYKAESAGSRVVLVDPRNTTKECSCCGVLTGKELRERQHNCPSCGLSMDRDLNAAINILNRATGGTPGSNACGDVSIGTSMKQDATPFRAG
jgi:putative transposase